MNRFCFKSLAALALMVLGFVPAAGADELVVMPFACLMAGDRPQLVPGENTGHRILGRRETTTFTACSPARPDQCRRWTVHRFDVDCGGRAVAWTDVVAASSGPRRAWVGRDGVFRIRMPAWWAMQPDDPCYPGTAPYERFRPGVMRRLCADQEARQEDLALATVAFPPGYAPTFGLDAIFVPAPPLAGGGPLASVESPRSGLPAPDRAPIGGSGRPAAAEQTPPKPAEAVRPAKPAPAATASLQTPPAPKSAERTPTAPPPAVVPTRPGEVAAPAVVGDGPDVGRAQPVVPRILNAPAGEATVPPAPVEAPRAAAPVSRPEAGPASPAAGPAVDAAPATPPQPVVLAEAPDTDPAILLVGAASAGGLVLLAGAVAYLVMAGRRREQAAVPERDLHAVRLGDEPIRARALAVRPPVRDAAPAMSGLRPPAPPVRGDFATVPATAEEALAILGVGVDPGADLVAIKKMVDALRFSWHPDRAQDDQDRQLRELRIRQINAAWEILSADSRLRRTA